MNRQAIAEGYEPSLDPDRPTRSDIADQPPLPPFNRARAERTKQQLVDLQQRMKNHG